MRLEILLSSKEAADMVKQTEMPNISKNKQLAKGRELVYQGNPLIQSRKCFNTIGTRLFILGLVGLNPHLSKNDKFFDKDFPLIHIVPNEVAKVFGNTFYLKDLKTECEKLFNSIVTLDYKNGGFKLMHIFDVLEYFPKDGLYIQFDPKMKEYLLELVKGGYTAINIEQIFKLSSTYAVRLIELCLQYRNMTKGNVIERKLTPEDIRFYLNVPENAYKGRTDHFRQFVLDEPIKEIEKITDFKLTYHTEKEGRRIKFFVFELDISGLSDKAFNIKSERVDKLPVSAPFADVVAELVLQGFSRKSAKQIIDTVKDTVEVGLRLQYALKILPEYHKKNPIQNRLGFLRKAILEDWRKNDVKSKNAMNISDASKVKNSVELNNLDFEKQKMQQMIDDVNDAMRKTGITAADLQGNEQPIPLGMVKSIAQEFLQNNLSDTAKSILNTFHFTTERFKQVYMKDDFIPGENATLSHSGFNRLSDSFPLQF